MSAVLEQSFSGVSIASTTGLVLTVPTSIPVGSTLVIATNRGTIAGQSNGVSSIQVGANVAALQQAASARAATHDLAIHVIAVTEQISAGDLITITWTATATRKVAYAAVFSGLTGLVDAHSSQATGLGETSVGSQGSGTALSSTTTAAVTTESCVVVGATSLASTATATTSGTEIGEVRTAVGSADRGLTLQYLITDAPGARTISATNSASAGWAAGVITLPVSTEVPNPGGSLGYVIVGGQKKAVTSRSVIVGGQKKPVTSMSVIVGGQKKPLSR